ncbi:MAG TPA: ABC transporter permease [Ruminococcaceae bacterium]|nr:ABC transporter permease [Oscillospiraceae bacterium]
MTVSIIVNAISMGIIFLYGCVGEIFTERAGHLNLGIPGIMCIGAAGGAYAISIFGEKVNGVLLVILAIVFSMLFSAVSGLLYSFLTVTLQANQNVTGLTLTTFGVGFMKFLAMKIYSQSLFVKVSHLFQNLFNVSSDASPIAKIFLSHGILVYLGIIIAVVASFVLNRTRHGLYLKSIGENPGTADAVGINVALYKYVFITIGSAIAGLGGLYYIMDKSGGTQLAEAQIDKFGWMAVALVIASMWKPLLAAIGSTIFGGLYIYDAMSTTISLAAKKIFPIFPYLLTILVLIIASVVKSKNNQPPAHLGLPYFREDR